MQKSMLLKRRNFPFMNIYKGKVFSNCRPGNSKKKMLISKPMQSSSSHFLMHNKPREFIQQIDESEQFGAQEILFNPDISTEGFRPYGKL